MRTGSRPRLRLLAVTGVLALAGSGIAVAATLHGGGSSDAAAGSAHGDGPGGANGTVQIPTGSAASPGASGLGDGSAGSGSDGSTSGTSGATGSLTGTAGQDASATKAVSYLGHTFTVPADWSVVNLSQAPNTCVRFDVHAVYLGTPSAEQSCGAQTAAPVEGAIVVQPAASTAAASAQDSPIERRITATLPNARITASYATADRAEVARILASGGVPTPVVDQGTVSTSAAAGVVHANLTPYTGPITPAVVARFTATAHGTGFDACDAPSTADMTAWGASPFIAVGIYFGGAERACAQENLNAAWVTAQTAAGWHLLPLYIGPQVVSAEITSPAAQGKAAADDAAAQASSLGIGEGAVLYYDMESHSSGAAYSAAENATTQQFVTSWTAELHALGYQSGLYGNENGAQGAMVAALGQSGVTEPDVMDVANWNGQQDDDPGSDTAGHWNLHRVHQFEGDQNATYGGVTMNVDEDYFNLGQTCAAAVTSGGTTIVEPRDSLPCSRIPTPTS
ncbi:DUF1906 domain-containing protein [Actinospica durhamensis]|uniref:DUF1906 domain-containing protein n=1 Tax=Actinospica durhamensis TaxID=1508375 RepID=A0A941ENJ2_9ACTN|nr:DUF1906 domain-containing protein [Actinospica durhamensis]MBR7834340.1 DUF1906 domain-containing protein [Actinospica durhamensis]